jgi:hypothetical protein
MNTFYIVLIVAAVLAVLLALVWFCYICQSRDESQDQGTRVLNVDDIELGLEKRPARNPRVSISSTFLASFLYKSVLLRFFLVREAPGQAMADVGSNPGFT